MYTQPFSPFYKIIWGLSRRWIALFALFYGGFVGLPFLAPVFMQLGWQNAGKAIYALYSLLCHQLPERSFFLFGPRFTYSLPEIQAAWQNTTNPLILRQFIGNADMGWKIAWSDRMISLYTSIWFFGLLWYPFRQKIKPLPWWGMALLSMPLAVDGLTHLISDLSGIGQGFRDSNAWLITLTSGVFPSTFYTGDAWGSFNSMMRLLTGSLFGLGVVWFGFPYLDQAASSSQTDALQRSRSTQKAPRRQNSIVSRIAPMLGR
jgi:uncharacterized membrane protein